MENILSHFFYGMKNADLMTIQQVRRRPEDRLTVDLRQVLGRGRL